MKRQMDYPLSCAYNNQEVSDLGRYTNIPADCLGSALNSNTSRSLPACRVTRVTRAQRYLAAIKYSLAPTPCVEEGT